LIFAACAALNLLLRSALVVRPWLRVIGLGFAIRQDLLQPSRRDGPHLYAGPHRVPLLAAFTAVFLAFALCHIF
jgi:hypothetical protein